jgi:hypothetical protein
VHPDSVLQQHAATDRAASSIQRLPVSGIGRGVGMTSPPQQDAAQLLPPSRITGTFHCLPVLVQEESALVRRQLIENKLRVKRIVSLGRLGAHGVIVTRQKGHGPPYAGSGTRGSVTGRSALAFIWPDGDRHGRAVFIRCPWMRDGRRRFHGRGAR